MATDGERPPIESLEIEERDIQPEGEGHVEDDEPAYPNQAKDPLGQDGPSYEVNQARRGRDVNPGGSADPHDSLGHADSGDLS